MAILKSSGSCQMLLFDFSCVISSHRKSDNYSTRSATSRSQCHLSFDFSKGCCRGNPRILANYICNSMIVMNIVEPSINYSTFHYVMVKQAVWCQSLSGFRERLGHIMWRSLKKPPGTTSVLMVKQLEGTERSCPSSNSAISAERAGKLNFLNWFCGARLHSKPMHVSTGYPHCHIDASQNTMVWREVPH